MRKRFQTLSFIGLIAASAVAMAAVQGFALKRTPKEGQTYKYAMEGAVDFGGMDVTIKATVQETVTKVEADGKYSVEQKQLDGKISIQGNEQDMPASPGTTTIYKPNGEVVEIKADQSDPNTYRMATLGLTIDPGKMVNVGDKWSYEVKADSKTGVVTAKADYTVLGEEKVGTFDTVKIKAVVKESEGSEPASSESTVWLDKKDGAMVKSESKWINAPVPGAPGAINATVKMTRV